MQKIESVPSILNAQILVCNIILQWEKPGLLGEMAGFKASTRNIYKTSLEYLTVPETKEMLPKIKQRGYVKGHKSQLKELPMAKPETI